MSIVYHALSKEERRTTIQYAENYGPANVILFYKKKYDLPDPVSFNGSFVFWIPEQTGIDRAIYVSEEPRDSSAFFSSVELKAQNQSPYDRDPGYVYYLTKPKGDAAKSWNELKAEVLGEYTR